MTDRDLTIHFGALCEPLAEQIEKLGLTVTDAGELARIQIISTAVSTVTIHGFMSRLQSDRARQKLFRRLEKIVRVPVGQEGSSPADGALGRQDQSVHAEPLNPSETNHG